MKNLRAVLLLFLANTISGMAQGISMLAIPWYFARDGEMATFGLVYLLANIISLIWVPYAGVITDRFDRRKIFMVVFALGGCLIGGIALIGHLQQALAWWWVAAAFLFTFFNYNIHYPTLYSFVQEITEPRYYGRVTSAMEVQGQTTIMIAGAGAALLLEGTQNGQINVFGMLINVSFNVAPWTIYEIFTLDAATYFAAFLVIALARYTSLTERKGEEGNVWTRLRIGLRYLVANKYVTIFGIASYCVFVVTILEGFFIGPLYVSNHLESGGDVFAASEMYYAAGAVLSGLLILRLFSGKRGLNGIIILTLTCAFTCALQVVTRSDYIFYVTLLLFGLSNAGTRVLRVNYLFRVIPNAIYGRTNSVLNMANIAMRIAFLSVFAIPFFTQGNNVIYALSLLALFLVIAASVLIRYYRKFVHY